MYHPICNHVSQFEKKLQHIYSLKKYLDPVAGLRKTFINKTDMTAAFMELTVSRDIMERSLTE